MYLESLAANEGVNAQGASTVTQRAPCPRARPVRPVPIGIVARGSLETVEIWEIEPTRRAIGPATPLSLKTERCCA